MPGDMIPLKGVQVDVVASNGTTAREADGRRRQPNPLCATAENKPKDVPENQLMVVDAFTYGRFTVPRPGGSRLGKGNGTGVPGEPARPRDDLADRPSRRARRRRRARVSVRDRAAGRRREQRTDARASAVRRPARKRPRPFTTSESRTRPASKACGRGICRCSTATRAQHAARHDRQPREKPTSARATGSRRRCGATGRSPSPTVGTDSAGLTGRGRTRTKDQDDEPAAC